MHRQTLCHTDSISLRPYFICCAAPRRCQRTVNILLVVLFPNSVPVITALFTGPFTMFASKRIYCGWKSHSDAPFSSERTSLTNRIDSDVSLVSCLVFQMIRDKRVLSPCRGIVLTQRYLKGFFSVVRRRAMCDCVESHWKVKERVEKIEFWWQKKNADMMLLQPISGSYPDKDLGLVLKLVPLCKCWGVVSDCCFHLCWRFHFTWFI